jgi:hypothetical protein
MIKLALAAALAAALVVASTAAFADPLVTFEFEGARWTITNSADGAPVTAIHMTPGFGQVCPQHAIRIEKTTRGPGLTKDQAFRGDHQWHVMCDRAANAADHPVVQPHAPHPSGVVEVKI